MLQMAALGGSLAAGAYGGWKSGQAKKKAAQKQLKYMKKALNEYKAGSYDAYGNRLKGNADGTWSYDLTNSAKNARLGATKAMNALGNYQYKTGRDLANQNMVANNLANNKVAQANQGAAMKQALRTGSNLGAISAGFARQGSKNLRNAYLQGQAQAQNAPMYNANMVNTLAQTAANAQQPLGNIQTNLQNQVNGLNRTAMTQLNNIAQAQNNPYLHGQATAEMAQGISQGLGLMSNGMQQNALLQQLIKMYGGANV